MPVARSDVEAWEVAGFTAENGGLGRPVAQARLVVPTRIKLDSGGERLLWEWELPLRAEGVQPDSDLLNRFVALADADGAQILEFAKRWGVLDICEHGLPGSHEAERGPWRSQGRTPHCSAPVDADGWFSESIERWKFYAGQARAMLRIAARLNENKVGMREDWSVLDPDNPSWSGDAKTAAEDAEAKPLPAGPVSRAGAEARRVITEQETACLAPEGGHGDAVAVWAAVTIAEERRYVAESVTEWLVLGGVHIEVVWWEDRPRLQLQPSGLFGALAIQLASAIGRSDGLAFCTNCRQPYIPTRIPASSRRRYCLACTEQHVPQRDAARDYRRRKRDS